jgi:PhnB protein
MTEHSEHSAEPDARVDKVVEIGAPVERVWQALTTPEGLAQFYCDWATVVPGVGGTVQIHWNAGSLPPATVEAWEPNRRLRLVYPPHPGTEATTAEEWTLRDEGDQTVVRLVYEGFGPDTDWSEFYDRFDATASLVVDLLATWLDRHGGAPMTKAWAIVPIDAGLDEAWAAALGPDLTDDRGAPAAVAAGTEVSVALPGGDPIATTVVHVAPGNEATVEIPELDDARLMVAIRPGTETTALAIVELYTYGRPPAQVREWQARIDRAADALAPPGTPARTATRSRNMTQTQPPAYQPAGSHTVVPYLAVHDAAAAIDFYVDVFGATESSERFVDPEGKVGHAELAIGDSHVYLSDEFPDFGAISPRTLGGSSVALTVFVPDVDGAVARAETAGATVERPIEEAFYGTRRATIRDPFGHRWMVGTHVRDVSDEEFKAARDAYAETGEES